jgi:hypothetical protein
MMIRENMKKVFIEELNELGAMYYTVLGKNHMVTIPTVDYTITMEEGCGEVLVHVTNNRTQQVVVSTLFPISPDEVNWEALIGLK